MLFPVMRFVVVIRASDEVRGSDGFNLDQETVMERAAWNYRACGAIVPKHSCTCFIDCVPEVYVSDGDVQLEDAVPVATGGFENCMHVVERLFGLFLDRAELLFPGCRIDP